MQSEPGPQPHETCRPDIRFLYSAVPRGEVTERLQRREYKLSHAHGIQVAFCSQSNKNVQLLDLDVQWIIKLAEEHLRGRVGNKKPGRMAMRR